MSKRSASNGGERGIRTPGAFQLSSFQDYRIRPLCHLSFGEVVFLYDIGG